MNDYKVSFKDLKSRVGVDDVAYALGYRLDRKAGVGRYIEMVLGKGRERRDTIVICNPREKGAQTFFRRNGSSGDAVTLIRENLDSFFVTGKNEWQKIAKVMSRLANLPEPEYKEDRELVAASKVSKSFDPSRYEVKPLDLDHIPAIFSTRGFSDETVRRFAPFISLIRDRQNHNFNGFNIGFPYTSGIDESVQGYEIRGMGGYKSKAAGTNSSSAAWVADLSDGKNGLVANVFFCESAFDAMAFYEMNRLQLGKDIALVSLGGTFSDQQVTKVMECFPNARAFDCFDNDVPGRIYGLRMMALLEDFPIRIIRTDSGLSVEAKGKNFDVDDERSLVSQAASKLSIRYRMGQWHPDKAFKDWNDCLMGKTVTPLLTPTKHERDIALSEKRTSNLKL